LRYLKRNSIGGVGIKAQIWENVEFGYSSKEGEMISDKMASGSGSGSGDDIEKAAQKLVKELTEGEATEVKAVEA
jgi:hypothetical protein